jgi:hypothetical protein
MAEVSVTGRGSTLDAAVRHAKRLLDETFGDGNWELDSGQELSVEITPFMGGAVGEVEVTVYARADSHPAFAHLPSEAA